MGREGGNGGGGMAGELLTLLKLRLDPLHLQCGQRPRVHGGLQSCAFCAIWGDNTGPDTKQQNTGLAGFRVACPQCLARHGFRQTTVVVGA